MSPFNNNLSTEEIVVRPTTPIFNDRFWQETIITTGETVSCTSVAVRRMELFPDKIFVAYIVASTLTVKSAIITSPIQDMVWTIETTVSDCNSCALEFDGVFIKSGSVVDFFTETIPWLFYTTTTGIIKAGLLGGTFENLSGGNVTSIDVVRGIADEGKEIDQGLIIFYVYTGAIKYRQFISGVWQGEESVDLAPIDAVFVKVERLFDYRICLHVTDSSGALWEVFTKMYASGWNGNENLTLNTTMILVVTEIMYSEVQNSENITTLSEIIVSVLYALSPVIVSTENINDGFGNFGLKVNLSWDENIFGEVINAGSFIISDGYSGGWGGQSITKNGKILTITFMDFNNAINPIILTYTPGTLMGDVVAVATDNIVFDAIGLISNNWPKPAAIMVENNNETQIITGFDMLIESANWAENADAFIITAQEYDMIPDGTISLKTYVVESTENLIDPTKIQVTLTDAGRMKYPIGEVTVSYAKVYGNLLGDLGGQVDNFALSFTPTNITKVFNPNDVEYLITNTNITITCFDVTYVYGQLLENITTQADITIIVTKVGDLPL